MRPSTRKLSFSILILALAALACNRAYALVGVLTEGPPLVQPTAAAAATARPTSAAVQTATPLPLPPVQDREETCFPEEVWHPEEKLCFIEDPQLLEAVLPDFYERIQRDLDVYLAPQDDIIPRTETLLISFQVAGNELRDPDVQPVPPSLRPLQDPQRARQLWRYFAAIIPPAARVQLAEFNLLTDGGEETLASVEQTIDDPTLWALNIDPQDTRDFGDLTMTLVHEYGHLLTLNADQIAINEQVFAQPDDERLFAQAQAACPTYFTNEGCAREEAYLYAFYQSFWADIYDRWQEINDIPDDDDFYTAMDEFYADHREEFVTEYAVTAPEEDIAESWAHYVLLPPPDGQTRADEKIRFFAAYPELRALRQEIIARLYSRMIRMQP